MNKGDFVLYGVAMVLGLGAVYCAAQFLTSIFN
jgi:hypothetical protein